MQPFPEHILNLIKLLPGDPGVYQFFDSKGVIIYIGKAKNLKKRVSSYFQKKNHDSFKSKILVDKIRGVIMSEKIEKVERSQNIFELSIPFSLRFFFTVITNHINTKK